MRPGVTKPTETSVTALRKAMSEVVSVRGLLLTVRQGGVLWVVRAGADPRAWRKTVNEKGDGITPWQHGRPPIDSLLRTPEYFPCHRSLLIDYCCKELELGKYRPEKPRWEIVADDADEAEQWRAHVQREGYWDDLDYFPLPPQRKRTGPFPWACVPRPGERLIRREAPEPDEIIGIHDDSPVRRWRRIPRNQDGRMLLPPLSLTDQPHFTLRATIRRVRLCGELEQWAAEFPDGALAFLESHRFKERRWHLLNLWIRVPGGRELWDDVPALAWLAASSWLYKEKPVQRPFRSLRSLVQKPRSHLLRWLDLPTGKGTIELLRKINPSLMTPRFAHALCRVLRDEDKRRAWLNLPKKAGFRELSLLAYDLPISFPILREVNQKAEAGGERRSQPVLSLYLDCLRMIRAMDVDIIGRPELARVRSPGRLVEFHDQLVREMGLDFQLPEVEAEEGFDGAMPGYRVPRMTSPVPAPIPPPDWMRPLETMQALRSEGREMHHCVGSYESRIAVGDYYAYGIDHPDLGRATLGIRWFRNGWRVAEIRGSRNESVSCELASAVHAWIENTPPVVRSFSGESHDTPLAGKGDGPKQAESVDVPGPVVVKEGDYRVNWSDDDILF